LIANQSL